MKVLQINSHYDQGGAARIVACIHRELLQQNEESYVAYGRGKEAQEQNVYRFGDAAGVYLSALTSRLAGVSGWMNQAATRRLLAYLDQVRPDLVHLHAVHGYYVNLPMLFSWLNDHRIPCVWTFHDCYAFTGNCGYFFECDRWKSGCGQCPHIHSYPNSLLLDRSAWQWQKKKELFTQGRKIIVSPSQWLTEEAKASFMGIYPCVTIHNGIDSKHTFYVRDRQACRKKHGFKEAEKLILGVSVGFDDVRKGASYLIQMAKDLRGEGKVILIGWNEKDNRMLQGTDNIITLPSTASTELLAEYYSLADVFVVPSLAENYPTVALEAMACGTPVVGFGVGGIPEQLVNGRGIAVEAGNQQAFDDAVRRVLAGETLCGSALAEEIARENDVGTMTKAYLEVYRNLLEEN